VGCFGIVVCVCVCVGQGAHFYNRSGAGGDHGSAAIRGVVGHCCPAPWYRVVCVCLLVCVFVCVRCVYV
jgi:hypothetical protein